jgi:hypothetical protein
MAEPEHSPQSEERELTRELAAIRVELARLNAHRFVRQMNSPFRMLGATFARGMALGLGTAVGATILVSVVAFMLTQVDFIPILGQWAARIAEQIRLHD